MTRACFTGLKHMTMNHTINVSIAGVAFVLDSEGYELLKDYLVRIEVAYKDDPDGAEILSDIEARVSELILNRQSSDMIVSPELIREIIGQLGWPDGVTAQGPAGEPKYLRTARTMPYPAGSTGIRTARSSAASATGWPLISASIRRWCACCSVRLC